MFKNTVSALGLAIILFFVYAGCDDKKGQGDCHSCRSDRITLVSPNGLHKVIIQATDKGAGVWISGADKRPQVALYEWEGQGAAVGVYGDYTGGRPVKGLDACIAAHGDGGGYLQLVDGENVPRHFDADILGNSK